MEGNPISSTGRALTLNISGRESLPFRPGEVISAEVVQTGADNTATVKIKNMVLEVQTDVALSKGDILALRVERSDNTICLRLAGGAATESAGHIRNTIVSEMSKLDRVQSGSEGMSSLVSLLKTIPPQLQQGLPEISIVERFLLQIDHLSGKAMKDVVENGGVFFENKLRILALGIEADGKNADIEAGRIIANDLKASLLRLKDTFLNSPGKLENLRSMIRPDELIDALNTVIRNIEFYQLQSKLTDSLQFFLPLIWKQLRDGEIIFRESDRGQPGDSSYSCIIHLDLEDVGKVKVNLLLHAGHIHMACSAENESLYHLLQGGVDMLKDQFSKAGLRIGRLQMHHQAGISFDNASGAGLSIRT